MNNREITERVFVARMYKEATTPMTRTDSDLPANVAAGGAMAGRLSLPFPIISALLTGGVRSLMDTPEDKKKERGRFHRFARGAAYGGLVPMGAGVGMGLGAAPGATAGMLGGPLGMLAGGTGGAAAGSVAGGVGTYAVLKKLLGD
jgi:hypothetical protein